MKHSAAQDSAAKKRRWESGSHNDAGREGAGAGLSLARIQKITGLGTTTIMRILNNQRRRAHNAPASVNSALIPRRR
jgi:hypothetical protein